MDEMMLIGCRTPGAVETMPSPEIYSHITEIY